MAESKHSEVSYVDNYDVFINFRGSDTRGGFVKHLYDGLVAEGICVFLDEEELTYGKPLAEELPQAIANSRIYIPILSPTYASSKWCLRELAEIVRNKQEFKEKAILPVFYGVRANDVKLKTNRFEEYLKSHKENEDATTFQRWTDALMSIPKYKGWSVPINDSDKDEKMCQDIIKWVSVMLKVRQKQMPERTFGLQGPVNKIIKLLDLGSLTMRVVGVYGLGGMGKTTLAKEVYNMLCDSFDRCSFLDDVRRSFNEDEGSRGCLELQKKLLKDISRQDISHQERVDAILHTDQAISSIQRTLKDKSVLLVFDDVSNADQIFRLIGERFDSFSGGSRIIITGRNRKALEIKGGPDAKFHEMLGMNRAYALECFSWHAFRKISPPDEDYSLLTNDVLHLTKGLPLSLEVTGSLLYGASKNKWKSIIKKLKETPQKEVLKRLKIGYDELSDEAKEIFLDIACFFLNKEKDIFWSEKKERPRHEIYMWKSCGFYPELMIEELASMCFIKIRQGRYWMHDHIKDLGRSIARQGGSEHLGQCTRLWESNDAIDILTRRNTENNSIKAIQLFTADADAYEKWSFGSETFVNLDKLRFLQLNNHHEYFTKGLIEVNLVGAFEHVFPNLRWLCWTAAPEQFSATNVYMRKLVILELHRSTLDESWGGWKEIKGLHRLQVLAVTHCDRLRKIPDFSQYKSLKRLILHDCRYLKEIDGSIGKLRALKYVYINLCTSLRELPEEIFNLPQLKEIFVLKCYRLEGLWSPSQWSSSITWVEIHDCPWLKFVPGTLVQGKHLVHVPLMVLSRDQEETEAYSNWIGSGNFVDIDITSRCNNGEEMNWVQRGQAKLSEIGSSKPFCRKNDHNDQQSDSSDDLDNLFDWLEKESEDNTNMLPTEAYSSSVTADPMEPQSLLVYDEDAPQAVSPLVTDTKEAKENHDLLVKCISEDIGFSGGLPMAACLIFKCLLHWRSFEAERTTIFDRIIQTIGASIDVQENIDHLLYYWLSNVCTLLLLLQGTLKESGAASMPPQMRRASVSLFGRAYQGLRESPQSVGVSFLSSRTLGGVDDVRQIEAKYPALLFKQQLTSLLDKIYGMMRDNLKKEISPLLGLCIQAPRKSRAPTRRRPQANDVAQQALNTHWKSMITSLNNCLKTMRANYVPPFVVRKIFTQIFSFINVQLFNSILLRRECCSFSNGEYVKAGLAELKQWCVDATEEFVGPAPDELKHIRQAVGFLVIHQKQNKSLKEITNDLCPVLSIQQLYRISTMYWDDKYGTHTVSAEVIATMRMMMTEASNNAVSTSFLLDDDSSIPFTLEDISKSVQKIDVPEIDPPPMVRENSGFSFLLQRSDDVDNLLDRLKKESEDTNTLPTEPHPSLIADQMDIKGFSMDKSSSSNSPKNDPSSATDKMAIYEQPQSLLVYDEDAPQAVSPLVTDTKEAKENHDLLVKCISEDIGFSGGLPMAACLIFKCLLHWRSFEAERTTIFDRIIQTIGASIDVQENIDHLLYYWLSNVCTLLLLLQGTLKESGAASMPPQMRRASVSLFGRAYQGLRESPQSVGVSFLNSRTLGGVDDVRQVEAKYPALLFKQQLTSLLDKIYGMMRDNLKKEISPLLGLCIQAPRKSRAPTRRRPQANDVAQQALNTHWKSMITSLNNCLNTMRANYVPPFVVRKIFTQIFSFINVQLFNSILLRRECCSFSNGEYVKAGLAELKQWCVDATEEFVGPAPDELKHIRQAVGFLVIHQKQNKSLKEITNDLCPVLSIQQLYRISTMYWDDKYGTHTVSAEVIATMRMMMTEASNNAVSTSFLLDDDSSIPFTLEEISKSVQQIEVPEIDPPQLLRENSGFSFLLRHSE